jgi:arylsulfatase A-like enzyme
MLTRRDFLKMGGAVALGMAWPGHLERAARALGPRTSPPEGARPNIVFVLADDLSARAVGSFADPALGAMSGGRPVLRNLMTRDDGWVNFRNAYCTQGICGPSRATMLSGMYSHRHGVVKNSFGLIADADQSGWLPPLLRAAGYRTGMMGKYSFGRNDGRIPQPPGWDVWRPGGGLSAAVFPEAADFIRETPPEQPVFACVWPVDPHRPYRPQPRYRDAPVDVPPPSPPCYKTDYADRPLHMRRNRPLGERGLKSMAAKERTVGRVLLGMDDGIGLLIDTLEATGRWDNTVFIFAGDNGYMFGEFGMAAGKDNPYRPALNVPLVVRDPGATGARDEYRLVGNADIAATIAAYAGSPLDADGRSFIGVVRDTAVSWREEVFIEKPAATGKAPRTFTGLYAAPDGAPYTYVRYDTGEEELFDLTVDPWQLTSVHDRPEYAAARDVLRARTEELAG